MTATIPCACGSSFSTTPLLGVHLRRCAAGRRAAHADQMNRLLHGPNVLFPVITCVPVEVGFDRAAGRAITEYAVRCSTCGDLDQYPYEHFALFDKQAHGDFHLQWDELNDPYIRAREATP